MLTGHFRLGGALLAPGADNDLWGAQQEVEGEGGPAALPPPPAALAALQAFAWLEDLAAAKENAARPQAWAWTEAWITRFGRGKGPGWTADLTGARVLAWLNHSAFLLSAARKGEAEVFFTALWAQTRFLGRRWRRAGAGLPRLRALTALILARAALGGFAGPSKAMREVLAREAGRVMGAEGVLASRSPEALLEIELLLRWAGEALAASGQTPPPSLAEARAAILPLLRALRHMDGGLARFHGGEAGVPGRLEEALAAPLPEAPEAESAAPEAQEKPLPISAPEAFSVKALVAARAAREALAAAPPPDPRAMGFARLSAGRTSVILDAEAPPETRAAQASTLAFTLTSGRRPLIVSAGAGAAFGADWVAAARSSLLHSTLVLENFSSSRLAPGARAGLFDERAAVTSFRALDFPQGTGLSAQHDGWRQSHGLIHARELALSEDGRQLGGQDELLALWPAEKRRLADVLAAKGEGGLPFTLHFHLHPDVRAELDMGGSLVSLLLKSGEVWLFRPEPGVLPRLTPSVYLDPARVAPRPSLQIELEGRVTGPETKMTWTLAKAQNAPPQRAEVLDDEES